MRRAHAAKPQDPRQNRCARQYAISKAGTEWSQRICIDEEAGRTVGGFYKHFESRDKLAEEALSRAFEKWNEAFTRFAERKAISSVSDLLDNYLSQAHADYTRCDCPAAVVMNDGAPGSETLRPIYTDQIQKKLAALTTLMKRFAKPL